jgi:hypothetical protein
LYGVKLALFDGTLSGAARFLGAMILAGVRLWEC